VSKQKTLSAYSGKSVVDFLPPRIGKFRRKSNAKIRERWQAELVKTQAALEAAKKWLAWASREYNDA
jgi:hypothetical protein